MAKTKGPLIKPSSFKKGKLTPRAKRKHKEWVRQGTGRYR